MITEVVIKCCCSFFFFFFFIYVWLKNVTSQLIKLKLFHHFLVNSDDFLLKVPKIAKMGT